MPRYIANFSKENGARDFLVGNSPTAEMFLLEVLATYRNVKDVNILEYHPEAQPKFQGVEMLTFKQREKQDQLRSHPVPQDPPMEQPNWKPIATAVGKAWLGELWVRTDGEGREIYRISRGVPPGGHGYASWRAYAEFRKVFIRWPIIENSSK